MKWTNELNQALLKINTTTAILAIANILNKPIQALTLTDVEPYGIKRTSFYTAKKFWSNFNLETNCPEIQNSGNSEIRIIEQTSELDSSPEIRKIDTNGEVTIPVERWNYSMRTKGLVAYTYYPDKVVDYDTLADLKDEDWLGWLRDNVEVEKLGLLFSWPYSEAAQEYLYTFDDDDLYYVKKYAKSVRLNRERLDSLGERSKGLKDFRDNCALVTWND